MKKILFTAFLIISLIGFLMINNDPLKNHLNSWKIQMDLPGAKLVNTTTDKTRTYQTETLEAKGNDITIKIAKTSIEDHQKFIYDRKLSLNSLFMPTTSPYPEVITNIIECADEFKPKSQILEKGEIFTLFAGERFNFGICTSDLVKYSAIYGIFDCRSKGIIELWLFGKEGENLLPLAKSFSC
ncbi:MAG: hypothetical protein Q8P92_00075 [Candidatus Daviesbacteria bacterium]|nr:hypothetical protein [Candidatus Daviesbacteria bacterium]